MGAGAAGGERSTMVRRVEANPHGPVEDSVDGYAEACAYCTS